MSEKLGTPEFLETPREPAEHHETEKKLAEHEAKAEKQPNVHQLRSKIEKAALSSEEVRAKAEHAKPHRPKKDEYVSRETKKLVYQRTLLTVRRRLSPMARATSKIIHRPAVEVLSEAAGKTVARPSGLLGGGLVAFTGTAAYYYVTRHYGYPYRPSVFLFLLVAGFLIGWFLEGILKTFRRSR